MNIDQNLEILYKKPNISILITGANGYIGNNLKNYLSPHYKITSINRQSFDLRDIYDTKKWFENKYFDIIIHTAISGGNRLTQEDSSVVHNNLLMFDNLLDVNNHYSKIITFGSGAEFYTKKTPYGLSKKIINTICKNNNKCYNLRLYALFDSNEDNRRFIKSNIIRYLNRENIIIHNNKYMDFIYFSDFVQILEKYINNDNLPKNIDCVYKKKYNLIELANIINRLDTHSVNINLLNPFDDKDYIGQHTDLDLSYIGLEQGIENTYRNLKNEKGMVRTKQI